MAQTRGITRGRISDADKRLRQTAFRHARELMRARKRLESLEASQARDIQRIRDRYAARLAAEQATIEDRGGRLYEMMPRLLKVFGGTTRTVRFGGLMLSMRLGNPKLVVTDQAALERRLHQQGWTGKCVEVKRTIRRGPLRQLLQVPGGGFRRIAGAEVAQGDFLYVENVKIDPPGADSDDESAEVAGTQ